jgi:hypothetical protein
MRVVLVACALLLPPLLGCHGTGSGAAREPATVGTANNSTALALHELGQKPPWLFPATECPADVFPTTETRVTYVGTACDPDLKWCLDRCEASEGNGCYAAALRIEELKAAPQYSEALFLRACSLGVASGCTNRASGMLVLESQRADSWPCANRTFEAMCNRDDPWACTMWGASLARGSGVGQDLKRALEVLPKGCRFGREDEACAAALKLQDELKATQ